MLDARRKALGKDRAMDEQSLRQLIVEGESATVEFKIKAPRPAELAERICGMANNALGWVYYFWSEGWSLRGCGSC